ncbi:hypothetical protein M2159_009210 [Streptomyces sp. SAI-090]|nr:hypothetical protein [Streptomyces sp. SAI-090]
MASRRGGDVTGDSTPVHRDGHVPSPRLDRRSRQAAHRRPTRRGIRVLTRHSLERTFSLEPKAAPAACQDRTFYLTLWAASAQRFSGPRSSSASRGGMMTSRAWSPGVGSACTRPLTDRHERRPTPCPGRGRGGVRGVPRHLNAQKGQLPAGLGPYREAGGLHPERQEETSCCPTASRGAIRRSIRAPGSEGDGTWERTPARGDPRRQRRHDPCAAVLRRRWQRGLLRLRQGKELAPRRRQEDLRRERPAER